MPTIGNRSVSDQQIIAGGVGGGLCVFKIDSAAAQTASNDTNGNATQWIYQVTEQIKNGTGYGSWTAKTDGYTGNGYNFLEDGNTGTGRQQNGVDHDSADYPAGFSMQALQTNSMHPGIIIQVDDDTREAWLMPYNGEDGTC